MELTPLIDILFILNIFFLLNSHTLSHRGYRLQLPESNQPVQTAALPFAVLVDDLDRIFLDRRRVNLVQLESELASLKDKHQVLIQADEKSSYGQVMKVFDLLRKYQLTQVTLATQPRLGTGTKP